MKSRDLNQGWTVCALGTAPGHPSHFWPNWPRLEAQVPGSIFLDLIRNDVIADPRDGLNELGAQWVSRTSWEYQLEFDWAPDSTLPIRVIRLKSLDGVAKVFLNDQLLGQSDNKFLPFEAEVTSLLQVGANFLRVVFEPTQEVGTVRRNAYFEAESLDPQTPGFDSRCFVRTNACTFGWDWGPRLVGCGFSEGVELIEHNGRVLSFEVLQSPQVDGTFRVWSHTVCQGAVAFQTRWDQGEWIDGDFELIVDHPVQWWPNGSGEPHLYGAQMRSGDHTLERKVGLRTVELVRNTDSYGECFKFRVNGETLFAKGANWIPDSTFDGDISGEEISEQIETCRQLGFNMLRVWGGGNFESDAFYDACDAAGILVWQDFPFACHYYPESEEFLASVRAESSYQIQRLRSRTSLALWCGNNEVHQMHRQRWAGDLTPSRFYGESIFDRLLPALIQELDPGRAYIESSPIGESADRNLLDKLGGHGPNMGGWGDQHYWDVWHGRGDWPFYADADGRFASEFGFASSAGYSCYSPRELTECTSQSPIVRFHDRTGKAAGVIESLVELHYPVAENLEQWVYLSQLNQRDALRFAIEQFRRDPACDGTLIWQFNDLWPATSWSVQDASKSLKIAGFELQRLYGERLLCLVVDGDFLRVWAIGMRHEPVRIELISTAGAMLAEHEFEGDEVWQSNGVSVPLKEIDRTQTIAAAWIGDDPKTETWRCLAEPKDMQWQTPRLAVSYDDDKLAIKVDGLAMDVVVFDPAFPDNLTYQGQRGLCAFSGINWTIKVDCQTLPRELVILTQEGTHVVSFDHIESPSTN